MEVKGDLTTITLTDLPTATTTISTATLANVINSTETITIENSTSLLDEDSVPWYRPILKLLEKFDAWDWSFLAIGMVIRLLKIYQTYTS